MGWPAAAAGRPGSRGVLRGGAGDHRRGAVLADQSEQRRTGGSGGASDARAGGGRQPGAGLVDAVHGPAGRLDDRRPHNPLARRGDAGRRLRAAGLADVRARSALQRPGGAPAGPRAGHRRPLPLGPPSELPRRDARHARVGARVPEQRRGSRDRPRTDPARRPHQYRGGPARFTVRRPVRGRTVGGRGGSCPGSTDAGLRRAGPA